MSGAEEFSKNYPMKILIVEDNAINQMLFEKLLKKMGYIPKTSTHGFEGIDALKKEYFDIVFMDIYMPELNGFEAADIINKYWPKERAPIIIGVSASTYPSEVAKSHGMRAMLQKPIKVQEVQRILKSVYLEKNGSNETLINWEQMEESLMDKNLIEELVKCFLQEKSSLLDSLLEAIKEKDAVSVELAAHSIKSAVSNFHAEEVTRCSFNIEKLGKDSKFDQANELYASLADLLDRMSTEINNKYSFS
jgi:CheY-like chemotaxis protein